jgi:hypothetical protein
MNEDQRDVNENDEKSDSCNPCQKPAELPVIADGVLHE